jgi:P-type Ca2+ transporter type 2C
VSGPTPTQVGERWQGLTDTQVAQQRARYGWNDLPQPKGESAASLLLAQINSPPVYIVLAAAAISLVLSERTDFALIMVVVVIDAIVGFIQEYQAQRTYSSLRSLIRPTASVLRNGERRETDARELVPNDLVFLYAGEHIPADGLVIESSRLTVDEAILTGESVPVGKEAAPNPEAAFMGTTVIGGRGMLRVTSIGESTELGRIAASLRQVSEPATPLQVRLAAFSRTLARMVIVITVLILVVGILRGRGILEMLRISIVLAIAAIPQGLVIAVTVTLVVGMRRILARNGLVKRLLAVETLGSVTVICTDKTGTLTEGVMRVTESELTEPAHALETMVLCNNLEGPVELAIWEYARQQTRSDPQRLADSAERLAEEPFSSETKFMVTAVHLYGRGFDYLKGAPEVVLGMCSAGAEERAQTLALVDDWARAGLRTLGLAYRPLGPWGEHSGYTWAGLIGMEDPIRDGVPESIALAQHAGIRVKMITGDYVRTAEAIARRIGLDVGPERITEGASLEALDDRQLAETVERTTVFARIRPHDKLRIVQSLQARGEITAMIGDGVNDAPALHRANLGVVVGSASDVAKETADVVLLDNNFRTIVAAIGEGRVVFENIRKVVSYSLSNSFAEVIAIFGAMMLGWPAPLTVVQILWIHLICDGPSDIVLGFEPSEPGIMDQPPRRLSEQILPRLGLWLIGIVSLASASFALLLFGSYWLRLGNLPLANTFAYGTLAVNSLVYIFSYRSLRRSILHTGYLTANKPLLAAVASGLLVAVAAVVIPPLRRLLGLAALSLAQWGLIFAVALTLLLLVELAKYINGRRQATGGGQ